VDEVKLWTPSASLGRTYLKLVQSHAGEFVKDFYYKPYCWDSYYNQLTLKQKKWVDSLFVKPS
jgi:hypothetical protein